MTCAHGGRRPPPLDVARSSATAAVASSTTRTSMTLSRMRCNRFVAQVDRRGPSRESPLLRVRVSRDLDAAVREAAHQSGEPFSDRLRRTLERATRGTS